MKPDLPPCPCRAEHPVSSESRERLAKLLSSLSYTVPVASRGKIWLFPRIYIAMHGLKSSETAEIARRYGFKEMSKPK